MIQWQQLSSKYDLIKETIGQMEKGEETGTPHIQGAVRTTYGRHLQQLRGLLPRAHVEAAKNPVALQKYVTKPETRIGEIPTMKVATQGDVQSELHFLLESNGSRYIEGWNHKENFMMNLTRCELQIKKNWEILTDEVVTQLIKQGFYGVEFVMSNPQVRTAFKKYLPAILFRENLKKQSEA